MIVVDASIFIDQIFEYDPGRTMIADSLFLLLEERKIPIIEPGGWAGRGLERLAQLLLYNPEGQ